MPTDAAKRVDKKTSGPAGTASNRAVDKKTSGRKTDSGVAAGTSGKKNPSSQGS